MIKMEAHQVNEVFLHLYLRVYRSPSIGGVSEDGCHDIIGIVIDLALNR